MKQFILVLLLAVGSINAFADIENAPFIPEVDRRFNAIEQGNHYNYSTFPMGSKDGHWAQQEVQATYDFATYTGASSSYDLKVALPKNAVIQNTGIYSITQPTGAGTLAFQCQNAGNLLAATAPGSFATAGSAISGVETGPGSTWKTVTAACDITAVIASSTLTAGKVTVFVDYVIHQ